MSSAFLKNLGLKLNVLRKENKGCDIIFEIDKKKFFAHRIILIARLEYFEKILDLDWNRNKKMCINLVSSFFDPETFEDILEYVYTSEIVITKQNVSGILLTAKRLMDESLLQKIQIFLSSNIDAKNVFSVWKSAKNDNLKMLEKACAKFFVSNLSPELQESEEICWLSFENLENIFEELERVSKKELMFHLAVKWVESNLEENEAKFPRLLRKISLNSLNKKFLKDVVSKQSTLLQNHECTNLLIQALQHVPTEESVYVFGGKFKQELASVSKFEASKKVWTKIPSMSSKRMSFSCAVYRDKIFLCGGVDGSNVLNMLEEYDTQTNKFKFLNPMNHSRKDCASAILGDYLYVVGGTNSGGFVREVEKYSIKTNKWKTISPLSTDRTGLELVALKDKLYAIGGDDGENYLETVECYNPIENCWNFVQSMNHPNSYFGSAVMHDRIYVAGNERFEVFDSEENCWESLPSSNQCAHASRLVNIDGKLMLLGGTVGFKREAVGLSTVECFNFEKRVWVYDKPMTVGRCFYAAAVA